MGGTFHTYTCHICLHGMFGLLQDVRLPSSSGSTQVNDKGHSAIPVSLCFHSDSYSHSVVPIPFRLGSHSGFVPVRFLFRLRPHLLLVLLAALLPVGFFHWISFFCSAVRFFFRFRSGSVPVRFPSWFSSFSGLFVFRFHSCSFPVLIPVLLPFWFLHSGFLFPFHSVSCSGSVPVFAFLFRIHSGSVLFRFHSSLFLFGPNSHFGFRSSLIPPFWLLFHCNSYSG